jgi:NADH:ubiquinone oxidoreductase subunit 3 (subunit A)
MSTVLFSPIGVFIVFLARGALIFFGAGLIAPKGDKSGGKLKMYACGEDMPELKHSSSAAIFFHVALYFTIIDVAVLTIATLPGGASKLLSLFYLIGISIAVFALLKGETVHK